MAPLLPAIEARFVRFETTANQAVCCFDWRVLDRPDLFGSCYKQTVLELDISDDPENERFQNFPPGCQAMGCRLVVRV